MAEEQDINIAKGILRLRLSQMIVNEKYKAGIFKIPIHLAMGHEAIAVAVDAIMEKDDCLALTHRNIHYNLARTGSLKSILDEYLLKKEGLAHAELGSMNLANEEKNVAYTSSILGNNLPVATGLALGQKVKGNGGLTIVVTGDGAMEEGSFYESLLFMKSNALSALVIVENNQWSMHTKIEERRSGIDFAKFAAALGAEYDKLEGNDVYKYISRLTEIRARILENKTPMVLEVNITTLGGWHVEDGVNNEPRFIHPHAGPLLKTALVESAELENSVSDPVFVLRSYFDENILKVITQETLAMVKSEVGEA